MSEKTSTTPRELTHAQLVILGMQRELQNTTPFHLSKQQSISEIAPDTQRSNNGVNLRSSLENIYGLIGNPNGMAGETADHMRVPQHVGEEYNATGCSILQQSARSQYPNQLLTNMMNPVGNTTNDFYTEDKVFGRTCRVGVEVAGLHITDFEDHANQQSPFVIKSREFERVVHHQRDLSSNSLMDQMIYRQQSQQQHNVQIMHPSIKGPAFNTVYREDISQNFENTLTYFGEDLDTHENSLNMIVWGRNQSGQLSVDPKKSQVIKFPQLFNPFPGFFEKCTVKQIACGNAHTCLLIDTNGSQGGLTLFTLGSNKKGQLGIGKNIQFSAQPQSVGENLGFESLSCSKNSTFAVTALGEIYSWGSNKEGLLGLGLNTDQYLPQKIQIDGYVKLVSAGKNHVFALVRQKSGLISNEYESTLFAWGSNYYGQLGDSTYQGTSQPKEVQINLGAGDESSETLTVSVKENEPILVSCGDNFTIVQTQSEKIYACGQNIQGQLGLGPGVYSSKINKFTRQSYKFQDSEFEKIVSSDFTACITKMGSLYIWGPTPLGQFSEPKQFQQLFRKTDQSLSQLEVKDLSIGNNFGLIQDHNNLLVQIGSLFHENTRQHDSQTSGPQEINVSQLVQVLKGGPLQLDSFACGHDFVVCAASHNQTDLLKRFVTSNCSSNIRKQNQSRSIGATGAATVRRGDEMQNNVSMMYGGNQQQITKIFPSGRYAPNIQQQSVCSSLSPLRSSMMQETISNFGKRNDLLNRSAIINGYGQGKQIQALMALRESVTPVKEFAPANVNLLTIEHQAYQKSQHDIAQYQTHQARNQDHLPVQASGYSTLQDCDGKSNTPTAYHAAHLMQTPQPVTSQLPQKQLKMPLQLTSSLTSMPLLSQRGGGNVEYIDILIKEKQELQHSLNIEIQRRLLIERESAQHSCNQDDKNRLIKQIEGLKSDCEKLKTERKELLQDRDIKIDLLKGAECGLKAAQTEIDVLNQKIGALTSENEVLKLQIASSSTQTEQQKKDFSLIEDLLSKKSKEIYDLTVQLGCLKEENSQYKKEQDELKVAFEARINEVKERAESDYKQLTEDYHTYQERSKIDSETVESLRRQNQDQASIIREQAEKLRKLQAMNDKLRSVSRVKRASQFKLEQPSIANSSMMLHPKESDGAISSHYTSVGVENKKSQQSQEHSFQSVASKRTKTPAALNAQRNSKKLIEKENQVHSTVQEEGLKATATLTVDKDEGKAKPQISVKKPQHQQLVSHSSTNSQNLFKKQHQPVLQSNSDNSNRQNTNRDQGCLQVLPVTRKKSAGVPSQLSTKASLISQVVSGSVLKTNNSRVNALNQPSVTTSLQAKSLKEKTPTRNTALKTDQSQPELLQPRLKTGSILSKSPVVSSSHQSSFMQNKSPSLKPTPTQAKAKSTQQPNQPLPQHAFQLNSNEDSSIFDPRLLQNHVPSDQSLNKRRSSQQSFTLLQRHPHQEVTLGGIQCDSSPDTPQIAPGVILHQQQEKPIAYVMRSLDSPTKIVRQQANTQGGGVSSSMRYEDIKSSQQQQQLMKNASVSSSSTNNGQHTQIMNEMRNKLIDIQNNKQYIEQKIQEYEKKLQQLKGTSTSLVLSHNGPLQQLAHCDIPRQQQNYTGCQLSRSGSGMLLTTRSNRLQQ